MPSTRMLYLYRLHKSAQMTGPECRLCLPNCTGIYYTEQNNLYYRTSLSLQSIGIWLPL